jgi:hypothetical protein
MPLCELKVPSNQYSNRAKEGWVRICDLALANTLNGLEIPDPSDREYRISVSPEINEQEINISFSCGRDEYGVGEIFDPSEDKMKKSIEKIFGEYSFLGISKVTMEKWKGTSFAILDGKNRRDVVTPDKFIEGINMNGSVKLVLSPKIMESYSQGRNKEIGGYDNCGEFRLLGSRIAEFLGSNEGSVDVFLAKEAEADIGVEVDLANDNERLSDEEIDFLRDKIGEKVRESGLINNGGEKNVTLWIRQGTPEICIIG